MPIENLRELFLHELGDILYAEHKIVGMLEQMAAGAGDSELRDGFERHLDQTRGHVDRLESAFKALGGKPHAERCPGIDGIEAEHRQNLGELSEELRDLFSAGSAARTEHYEIAAYESLIPMGEALEENEVVGLLWENLRDEKETLQELNTVAEKLATVRGPGSAMV